MGGALSEWGKSVGAEETSVEVEERRQVVAQSADMCRHSLAISEKHCPSSESAGSSQPGRESS